MPLNADEIELGKEYYYVCQDLSSYALNTNFGDYTKLSPLRMEVDHITTDKGRIYGEREKCFYLPEELESLRSDRIRKHPFRAYLENKISGYDLNNSKGLAKRLMTALSSKGFENKCLFFGDLWYFFPNVDTNHADFIYLWADAKGLERGREGRVRMKPGRAFKKMFPFATDQEIESLVEWFKAEYSPLRLTVFSTTDPEEIAQVYTSERSNDRHFETSLAHKKLCDSCMRHEKEYFGTPLHPAYAFGSGDFELFFAKDQKDKLAARVLVAKHKTKPQAGPIYSTCQEGIDILCEKLKEIGATNPGEGNWENASILALRSDYGRLYGPYLDNHSKLENNGKYLAICSSGSIEHTHTGFYGEDVGYYCGWCDDHVDDEPEYVESVSRSVCSHCRSSDFSFCEYYEELYHGFDTVYLENGRTERWSMRAIENHAFECEESGDYWELSARFAVHGGAMLVAAKYIENGTYLQCAYDEEYWHKDEMVDVKGVWVHKDNVEAYLEQEEAA